MKILEELWPSVDMRTPEQIRKEIKDYLRGQGLNDEEIKVHMDHQDALDKQAKEANERREQLRARGLLPTEPDPIYSRDPFEGQPEKQKARDEYLKELFDAFNRGETDSE